MIYSLVNRRIEDVPPGKHGTGVTRFDSYLRRVFPDLESITPAMVQAGAVLFDESDVVIADNGLSLLVPPEVPTIVAHHGCAATHRERDPHWRTPATAKMVEDQREMFRRPNRTYVAPSAWVRDEFVRHLGLPGDYAQVIVNHVPLIATNPHRVKQWPVIIGDWRGSGKGSEVWPRIAALMPDVEFRPCAFRTDEERAVFYQDADLYLCLSVSEGGSYSMCDAEAAGLPIVSTEVGNQAEFHAYPLRLDVHRRPSIAVAALRAWFLAGQSRRFYDSFTFDAWATAWRNIVERAREGAEALLPLRHEGRSVQAPKKFLEPIGGWKR